MAAEAPQYERAPASTARVLFLAQLPPPTHGVTLMSARVHDTLAGLCAFEVSHLWLGGAESLGDISRKTASKYLAFLKFLAILGIRVATRRRYELAYVTFAPWTHAALRDALLIGMGKLLARRTLVHLHGDGLDAVLAGNTRTNRLIARLIRGSELIAITPETAAAAKSAGRFARVHLLPNTVADPGPGPAQGPDSQPLRCGWLANLDPRKGVLRYLDGMAEMVGRGLPVKGVVAGPATPFLSAEQLEAEIAGRGLSGRIEVLGPVYGEAKDRFWRSLDLFIYPSRHDHAPLVVLEALAYGAVPIVLESEGARAQLGDAFAPNILPHALEGAALAGAIADRVGAYVADPSRLAADRARTRAHYLSCHGEQSFRQRLAGIVNA